ncbi:hypothetical protein MKW92_047499 [Papaver armeniacum]|nr:hypothetical protein MKW92_047499 [Papaver armeniacum]
MAMVLWCNVIGRIVMMVEPVAGQPSLLELCGHAKEQKEGKDLKELLLAKKEKQIVRIIIKDRVVVSPSTHLDLPFKLI